jgi:hypothetical protein
VHGLLLCQTSSAMCRSPPGTCSCPERPDSADFQALTEFGSILCADRDRIAEGFELMEESMGVLNWPQSAEPVGAES